MLFFLFLILCPPPQKKKQKQKHNKNSPLPDHLETHCVNTSGSVSIREISGSSDPQVIISCVQAVDRFSIAGSPVSGTRVEYMACAFLQVEDQWYGSGTWEFLNGIDVP
jgi:hypothetical protein